MLPLLIWGTFTSLRTARFGGRRPLPTSASRGFAFELRSGLGSFGLGRWRHSAIGLAGAAPQCTVGEAQRRAESAGTRVTCRLIFRSEPVGLRRPATPGSQKRGLSICVRPIYVQQTYRPSSPSSLSSWQTTGLPGALSLLLSEPVCLNFLPQNVTIMSKSMSIGPSLTILNSIILPLLQALCLYDGK